MRAWLRIVLALFQGEMPGLDDGNTATMTTIRFYLPRWFALLANALMLGLGLSAPALAQTDQTDLRQPAIAVKAPERTFLNAITLAGARLVAVGEHGVIIYSDDQGVTWHQARVPVDVLLNAVAFANAQVGWAVGHFGVILYTADGGKTWQKQLDGNQVNQLALEAAKTATTQNSNLVTTDFALKRASLFLQTGPDKPFLAVAALSPTQAIAVGAYRLADRTTDGGKTWQDTSLNISDRLSHNLYGIAKIGQDIYIAAETGPVFLSKDDGVNFSAVTAPSGTTLFGVLGTGDGGVLVYGVAGAAYLSHDSGKSWRNVAINTTTNITTGLLLKSGAVLLASESGMLYISRDNGLTFRQVPEMVPMALTGLAQMMDGDVAAVGFNGVNILPAADFAQSQ